MASPLPRPLALGLACTGGALTFLAFPNWNYHFLAWVCAVPILLAARHATVKQGFGLGLLAGTITNAGGFGWITYMLREFGHLPAVATWAILGLQAVTQGLTMAAGIALWRWLVRRGAGEATAAWLALWAGEVAIPMIFPWFLGNSLSFELPMIQIADLGGVHLVSALAWAANAAVFGLVVAVLDRRLMAWRFVAATGLAVAMTYGYGVLRINQVDAEQAAAKKLKIGLVEGNIGIWEKEARHLDATSRAYTLRHNLLTHQKMSADLQARGAELIVWPESAYIPFGLLPLQHSLDHFVLLGTGGAMLRDDGQGLRAEAPDRLGLPRDLSLLAGLSSPRGDLLRLVDAGRRILTVTPAGAIVREAPGSEVIVATANSPVDWYGRLPDGLVFARSGKVWALPWPQPAKPGVAEPGGKDVELHELRSEMSAPVDLTAAACGVQQRCAAVGRRGAIVGVRNGVVRGETSPTVQDLWAAAGDAHSETLAAVGAAGTVLVDEGSGWRAENRGQKTWFAAWFCPNGDLWIGGESGEIARRSGNGTWHSERSVTADVMAGACDAEGRVLVAGRGGKVWRSANGTWVSVTGASDGEITAVLGLQAFESFALSRSAKRIVPSGAALPAPDVKYPDDVIGDMGLSDTERATPRRGFSVPLLFGALTHGKPLDPGPGHCEDCYNSAVLLGSSGSIQAIHDKAFLLAFGEYMPLGDRFPVLYELSPETSHFQSGTKVAPIDLALPDGRHASLGMLICYEDLLPRYARNVAVHNPHVLINLTNDAWFGQTAEPEHHLNLALMRTVEYRKWLVRSTNTGISVFIDAVGRRVAETKLTDAETLLREVPLLESTTVYATLGDWPLAALALLLGWTWLRTIGGSVPTLSTGAARASKPKKAKKKSAE